MQKIRITIIGSLFVITCVGIGYFGTQYAGRKPLQIFGLSIFGIGAIAQTYQFISQHKKSKISKAS